jgi:hypothetical protein
MQSQDGRDKMSKAQLTVGVLGAVTVITLAYVFYKNINNKK